MNLFINADDVLDAVEKVLSVDSVFIGSDYLGGPGRIFRHKTPSPFASPFIVLTMDQLTPDDMNIYSAELRVFFYGRLLANGQIDKSQSKCLSRIEELLNNAVPVLTGHTFQPLYCLGVVPCMYDFQDQSKARGLVRFRLEVCKDG